MFRGFEPSFQACGEQIVNATLEVYKQSRLNLLPTPRKSHYLFNLRDFSRVIQGVLLSTPTSNEDPLSLKRLWVHEVLRVYYDRLVDQEDQTWIVTMLHQVVASHLEESMNTMFSDLRTANKDVCKFCQFNV